MVDLAAFESLRATGSSMFPLVPSGSVLELEAVDAFGVQVGDIVAFVARRGLVAHRVTDVRHPAGGLSFTLRGDAQGCTDVVGADALAYRVRRVSYGVFSYTTRGLVGRALSHFALRRSLAFRCIEWAATTLAVLHRYWHRHQAQSL